MTAERKYPVKCPELDSVATDPHELLRQMTCRWEPPKSHLRSFLNWVSLTGIRLWGVIVALTLCSLVACSFFAPYRNTAILLWIYCLVLVSAPAAIGMGVDRYVMIIEPLLYLLIVLLVFTLSNCRLEKCIAFTEPLSKEN